MADDLNNPEHTSGKPAIGPIVKEPPETESATAQLPYPVVGLGASAGGVEAFIEVLKALSPNTGMSFVLVSNLAAEETGDLPALLGQHTRMPVGWIAGGERPEPNRVYVVPPDKRVELVKGNLVMEERPADGRSAVTIDRFFRSLASDQRNRVIGVLLSGNERDGALGLKAVKGEGGISIAQDPESAQFANMPQAGILIDHVDLVLPPAQIGRELSRLSGPMRRGELSVAEQTPAGNGEEPHFARILTLLRSVSGIDFRLYKPATLRRRTLRRMMLRHIDTLAEYAAYLHLHAEELHNLHEDVLINVTRFFRDPEVFHALRTQVLPQMFEHRPPEQQVRIWVAGCSSGEEVYSIAICLLEAVASLAIEPPMQIFGTDASEVSVERARTAIYPDTIVTDVSPERLQRFFVKVDGVYQISKRVRDLCIFARQNLCTDPPFSRLDLVSCRNVLIYLGPQVQQRVITTIHYALRPNGYLLLGNAESIRDNSDLFAPADRKHRFYTKTHANSRMISDSVPAAARGDVSRRPAAAPTRDVLTEPELERAADRIVLARYTPPGIVLNEAMEVLQVRGQVAPYLEMPPGKATLQFMRMAREGLAPALRDPIRRAIAESVPVTVGGLSVRYGEEILNFRVDILPMEGLQRRSRAFLLLFVAQAATAAAHPAGEMESPLAGSADELNREIGRLRHELSSSRLYLQSLIEEREERNQELASAYEEFQSANEELLSGNEELETAKEEMQSANEELQTVNEELRNRNTALVHASNDLNNVLTSVNIPVVILGGDFAIRQFTPPAEHLMRIRRSDIGRPITEIRLNLRVDDLEPMLTGVLETLIMREIEVQDSSGNWYLLRIRPYRTTDNKIDGLVLVMLDIDQRRRAEQAMQDSRDLAQAVVEAVPVPLAVLGHDLRIRSANAAFRELTVLGNQDLRGRSFPEFANLLWGVADLQPRLEELCARSSTDSCLSLEHEVQGPEEGVLRVTGHAIHNVLDPCILVAVEDITSARKDEGLLRRQGEQISGEATRSATALDRTENALRALAARLFISQEEERRRVARELHDDVGQKLAILEIDTEKLRQNLPADPHEARRALEDLRTRVAALSHDVREISHGLHPSVLEDLGLSHALKSLIEEFADREQMLATFVGKRVPEHIPVQISAAVYRIAQEALRNVAKHAGKTHVKVTLQGTKDRLRLIVRDSGEGFDTTAKVAPGLGLVSMRERASLAGGTFDIKSELGEGTTVTVTVPLTRSMR